MANQLNWRRAALLTVLLAVLAVPPGLAWAQTSDNRPPGGERESGDRPPGGDRAGRFGRGGRRGGGNGGQRGGAGYERGRDRGGNFDRNGDGNRRPPESQPAATAPAPAQSTTAAPSSTSFGTVSEAERIRKSASDIIKKNDKNSNGILEGDELKDLGMSRGADQDGDGKITHNELVLFYTSKSSSSSTPPATHTISTVEPPVASKTQSDAGADGLITNTSRKSYRFKSAKDRNSSWRFASKDANGDGQVSMSEFASSWNDRTAAEFQRYDKDNDGMITAEEAK